MSTSYKTLWQEANKQNQQLKADIEQMRREHGKALDKLHDFIASNRSNLAETRPIVDLRGISRHMRVARFTPQQWAQRGLLPPVDFPEISEPLWYADTIRDGFANRTGRIWYDTPDDEELSPAA
jgi:hypothetical protein